MRWVVLSDDWPPQLGGVATWSFGAARALAEAGDQVRVFCRNRDGLVAPPGVQVTGVRGRSFGRRGAWWAAVHGALELGQADAVLATTWTMATAVVQPLKALGVPLHVVFHGSGATRPPSDPAAFARVCRSARVWAVSEYLVGCLAQRGVEARWIPSPIDPGPRTFDADGPWVMVARATPLKGGDRFVRIVAAGGAQGIIVGDGTALDGWKQLASELGASVQFLGALGRQQTSSVLDGAACSMLLSRVDLDGSGAEGLGLVLLEARARGVLAVGSDVGGIPEAANLVLQDADDATGSAKAIRAALTRSTGPLSAHGRTPLGLALGAGYRA